MAEFVGGAALASLKEWGIRTEQKETDITVVNNVATQILDGDPERMGAVIINQDADPARLSKKSSVTTSLGAPVDGAGGVVALTPRSDGEGVGQEWFYILSGAAPGVVTVITLRRRNA